ncbi:MAG: NAD(P)/FAD-dependent oxidoreductase [Cyanobacteria bacterium P01_A01_bin.17]
MKIVVVGGGAAGFFGAIACAEACPQAQITLLEAGKTLLAKVRISGGGRCNVTHSCFDPAVLVQHYPRGGKALRGAFSRFQPQDTVAWYAQHQVKLKTEADGRMFPVTDDSDTIVQCLLQASRRLRIEILTGAAVSGIVKQASGFRVMMVSGRERRCDRILLATGSSPQGWRIARSLGHKIIPPVPSLFTFKIKDARLENLAGVSVNPAHVRLKTEDENGKVSTLEQMGPLLITHWGVSGPAVLKLSAWGARALNTARYRGQLTINWLPESKPEQVREVLQGTRERGARRAIATHNPVKIPQRLWQRLIDAARISKDKRWADLSKKDLNRLLMHLTQDIYEIQGKGVFKDEFVTCGGVALKEVNFKTLESRCCSGLFFAGEVLDIDGITGGFNFQSAWTTAWLAGQALGQKLSEDN